ncbi:MAG: DUF853 family protein [Alphaproteobacteria bacterium]|nr:DUF853 family protein [Alphaproteobacteria bacterium]
MEDAIWLGRGERDQSLLLRYANRHGLIAGATGTGKTVTLQILAEGFSQAGIPVFAADIKGDLAGLSQAGEPKPFLAERAGKIGLAPLTFAPAPVVFWDVLGERGHPVRATISEMGPLLLSRLLDLNAVQEGVLNIAFRLADEEGLLLLDLKDLRALLTLVSENAKALSARYGNVSTASVGAIQRALLVLEEQGAEHFFGEPALALSDFLRTAPDGRGILNILDATRLIESPRLYATFLLWLLSELFEELPEIGDSEKPKLVFFFDEAHLLFDEAPKALLERITQVVRLIRSKGVGVYFITQNPQDIPDPVGSQLGNRIQHALRAFTPKETKAVRIAAESFRKNPAFDTAEAISHLSVGEALTSLLEDKGVPGIVERTLIRPPRSRIGAIGQSEREAILKASPLGALYNTPIDRLSAYEQLRAREAKGAMEPDPEPRPRTPRKTSSAPDVGILDTILKGDGRRESTGEAFVKSVARSVGSSLGRSIMRGLFGTMRRR